MQYSQKSLSGRLFVGTASLLRSLSVPTSAKSFLPVIRNPYPEVIRGCVAISATRLVFVNWVVFIVMEGGASRPLIPTALTY